MSDWNVVAVDFNGVINPFDGNFNPTCNPQQNVVCMTLDKSTANNGTKLTVTTLNSTPAAPQGSPAGTPGFEPYMIFSFAKGSTAFHYWPGVVFAQ